MLNCVKKKKKTKLIENLICKLSKKKSAVNEIKRLAVTTTKLCV